MKPKSKGQTGVAYACARDQMGDGYSYMLKGDTLRSRARACVDFYGPAIARAVRSLARAGKRHLVPTLRLIVRNGKAVVLNDWLRISDTLSGSVGEDGALTEKNAYHVRIRALKELKRRADEFTWTMVGGVPGSVADGASDGTAG